MSGVLNYTTKVPAARTVSECASILADHGADAIATTYADRRPTGVRFQFGGSTTRRGLRSSHINQAGLKSREHAERVAWRVVKDWLEAQMALVAAKQVPLDEVMLPYLITPSGRPLRQDWREHRALPGGES